MAQIIAQGAQIIADRFEIEQLVGSGGMGEVFRAKDRLSGGLVAVKLLQASNEKDATRFTREAQILAEVSHPRIVKYVAHGVTQIGSVNRPYIAMEWLEGEDLADRLARKEMAVAEAIGLTRRVAEGLAALHERGVVHRDVKPPNLFLPNKEVDRVKVLDLGVARFINASRPTTRSGVMVGTPGYMAPEQARGSREIDARADIFALGCVLYECVTGRPAFVGENIAALLAKILIENPAPLSDGGVEAPPELEALVARMLAKHPSARPASAAQLLREIEALPDMDTVVASRAHHQAIRALTGTERRLVSVVMASMPGATSLGAYGVDTTADSSVETVDASQDPRLIAASFGGEAEILADGSLVVALSGKGTAGDQAAQAARCALALRSHLMDAHIALATGLASMTGRSVVGEVIERAAALVAVAKARAPLSRGEDTLAGQSPVYLDPTTAGLLDMRFDVGGDERGLFIRGLRERESKPRTLLGKPTPFVGRDRETSTLLGIFDECVNEPVARAVLVTGPAGAGKSRLVAELLRRIADRDEHTETWIARADPMSEGSPFSLLAQLLRRAAGIVGGEPLVARQQKLRARVARHVPAADVQRVTEFLGEIASAPFSDTDSVQLHAARNDAILMGDQMRRAFADFVLAEANAGPVALIVEDLHWGDRPSVTFLDAALRAAGDAPLFVLAVARGEVHDLFPALWEQRSLQEIRLGPLTRRAGERLIRDVLGDKVSSEDCARLLDVASGNAFYLEELIRAHAEGNAGVPSTVLAMMEARLERLDPKERHVLRAASVFGEVFWRGGLVTLTGYEPRVVDEWLSDLGTREIIQRREPPRFPQETEYSFRHALVRDAAYHMLTAEDTTLGHGLAAEWLERSGEHEPMVLGEHFERGGQAERAAAFFARAATQALEGNDFVAARLRAERAVRAGGAGDEVGRLRLLAAEASRWGGEHGAALEHARAAMQQLEAGSDAWYVAVAEAVEAAMTLGDTAQARELARPVRDLDIGEARPSAARVVATSRIAVRLAVAGLFDESSSMIERAERDVAKLDAVEQGARGFVLAARVTRARWQGDTEDAALLAQEAVAIFDLVGDLRNAAAMRHLCGFAYVLLGAFSTGEAMLKEAIDAAERLGLVGVVNEARLHLCQLEARSGRIEEAVAIIEPVIAGFAAQRDKIGEGLARAYLGGAYHLADREEDAEREILLAKPLLEHSPPYLAPLLAVLTLATADMGKNEIAAEAGVEAMRLLKETGGAVEGHLIVSLAYAEALHAKGDKEGARKAIRDARDRLLARADKIKNMELRRGFLERVAEHQRILARTGEWLA